MSKLLAHFKAMQGKAAELIDPGANYHEFSGDASAHASDSEAQEALFIGDMIYMLDGPEQRAAEAEASFDYIGEATLTLSNTYHGDKATLAEARAIMDDFIYAGKRLDKLKKALFYGKGDDIGLTNARNVETMTLAPAMMAGGHDIDGDQYAHFTNLVHGLVGVATESVEGIEALYKAIWGAEAIDLTNVVEESGDGFWYHAIIFSELDTDFYTEQRRNIAKLRKRFPNAFNEYDAINRDLPGERSVLELEIELGGKIDLGGGFSLDLDEARRQAHRNLLEDFVDGELEPHSPALSEHVEALRAERPVDPETALAAAEPESIAEQAARFALRCPRCQLTNGQHRPGCVGVAGGAK